MCKIVYAGRGKPEMINVIIIQLQVLDPNGMNTNVHHIFNFLFVKYFVT